MNNNFQCLHLFYQTYTLDTRYDFGYGKYIFMVKQCSSVLNKIDKKN